MFLSYSIFFFNPIKCLMNTLKYVWRKIRFKETNKDILYYLNFKNFKNLRYKFVNYLLIIINIIIIII